MLLPKLLPALLLAVVPLAAQALTVQPSGAAPATESRTVPLASGSILRVHNVNGLVKVEAWDRAEVQFTGEFKPSSDGEQVKVVLEPVSGGLEVRGVYPKHHGWGAYRGAQCQMTLKVPRQVRPTLETVNGGIELTGTEGRASLTTVNGGVQAKSLPEALEVSTVNGAISLEGVTGPVVLNTVNGGIRLTEVAGDVHAETTNGGVSATLSGTTWQGAGLDLRTTNGGVTLEIPRGYNARLETGTTNGGFSTDFPITIQGSLGRRITTTLGKGGPMIRATTVNGGVRIRAR